MCCGNSRQSLTDFGWEGGNLPRVFKANALHQYCSEVRAVLLLWGSFFLLLKIQLGRPLADLCDTLNLVPDCSYLRPNKLL